MDTGDLVIRGTVRIAVLLYVLAYVLPAGRWLWTLGCFAYLLHVAAAFHFAHGWSHDHAFETTKLRSLETTGWDSGSGLYVNYAFTLVWLGDVALLWLGVRQPRWLFWSVHGFMAFMMFNAVIVFGQGAIRWWGLAAGVLLALKFVRLRV